MRGRCISSGIVEEEGEDGGMGRGGGGRCEESVVFCSSSTEGRYTDLRGLWLLVLYPRTTKLTINFFFFKLMDVVTKREV